MQLTRIFKSKPYDVDFGSAGWELKLSSEELGFLPPKNPEDAKIIALAMAFFNAEITWTMAVGEGAITPELFAHKMKSLKQNFKTILEKADLLRNRGAHDDQPAG